MGGSVLIIKHLNLSPHRLISGTVGLFNILQTQKFPVSCVIDFSVSELKFSHGFPAPPRGKI